MDMEVEMEKPWGPECCSQEYCTLIEKTGLRETSFVWRMPNGIETVSYCRPYEFVEKGYRRAWFSEEILRFIEWAADNQLRQQQISAYCIHINSFRNGIDSIENVYRAQFFWWLPEQPAREHRVDGALLSNSSDALANLFLALFDQGVITKNDIDF
jgi:hypothetical protein